MKAALAVFVAGLVLLAYAMILPAYKDESTFEERYARLGHGDSAAFHSLRQEMLTPKYQLQDCGTTLIVLALPIALRRRILSLMTPRAVWPYVGAALLAPMLATSAFVFDLLLGMRRGEYPHWADTLAIPLMGVPVLFAIALAWSLLHLGFLAGVPRRSVPLKVAFSRSSNPWLLVVGALTLVATAALLSEGAIWFALPCIAWLYLYIALAAVRRGVDA